MNKLEENIDKLEAIRNEKIDNYQEKINCFNQKIGEAKTEEYEKIRELRIATIKNNLRSRAEANKG